MILDGKALALKIEDGLKAQIDYLWQSRDAVSAFEKILSTQNLDNIPLEIVNHIR